MKITSKELRHHIENSNIENVYLFNGPEIGEKKEIIESIKKKVFNERSPVVYTYYCDESLNNADLIDTLSSGLLFSDKKIIILKSIENINFKTVKQLEKFIISNCFKSDEFENLILNKLNDNNRKCLLSFYSKDKNNYVLSDSVKKKDKIKILQIFKSINYFVNRDTYLIMLNETNEKILDELMDLILPEQNIMFWEMFESQKVEWIRNEFKKFGFFINNETINFILDMIPNNTLQLRDEIVKIVNLFNEKGNKKNNIIELSFIEDYLEYSKEESIFSLYNSMLNGNLEKSLIILNNIINSDEAGLLNGLAWAHRRFLRVLDLYENQGKTLNEIFNNLKILSRKNQDDLKKGIERYEFDFAANMFYLISELDYYLKILPDKLKLIKLQEFIINFIGRMKLNKVLDGDLQLIEY
ncbi:MAG: hypothetical protein JXB50_16290 [Spirochaetes bacterium]|nr:hypothetical protein [Spirochaetota bacterium]